VQELEVIQVWNTAGTYDELASDTSNLMNQVYGEMVNHIFHHAQLKLTYYS
jgi:hypothetical protein